VSVPALSQEYRRFSEVETQLTRLARDHAALLQLETIGRSAGGRAIHAVRIAAPGAVPPDTRPAVFVGANIAGYHNAGVEAAMHLIGKLTAQPSLAESRTFYIVPVLNPDAHDGLFAPIRRRIAGNGKAIDHDVDGLTGEDPPNDLNNDKRITQMRIADPAGTLIPDPKEPRLLIPAIDRKGIYRLVAEGADDDNDGIYNEDAPDGIQPAINFAHAFPDGNPDAGLFPGLAPESKAVMDYLLKHRNIALAFVYGPANHLLDPPRGSGPPPPSRFRPTPQLAAPLGLDATREYSLDEAWEEVKDSAFVRSRNITKDDLADFFNSGPARRPAPEDLKTLAAIGEEYKKRLDKAGLDSKRSARQSPNGGFAPWLYYQYGVATIELDVWGVPKAKTPGANDALAWADTNLPGAFTAWTPVTLPNGVKAEVGGLDPFLELAPPISFLLPALEVHTETVLDAAAKLARLEITDVKVEPLSAGVWKVKATAVNTGQLPTHSQHATRARTFLPVRLEVVPGINARLLNGSRFAASERLAAHTGTLQAEWILKADAGAEIVVNVTSSNAGTATKTVRLGGQN